MPDFKALLSKPVGEIEKPKPIPNGTYFGSVRAFKLDEVGDKKTPVCTYALNVTEAGDDVDKGLLEGIDLAKKTNIRVDFYLSEDAQYRCKEFLIRLGINDGGGTRSLGEMIPEAVNKPVMFTVTQTVSKKDPSEIYNNVDSNSITIRPGV